MASLTIRNLDDAVKHRLRLRAAEHDHSMEDEARDILRAALIGGVSTAVGAAATTLHGWLRNSVAIAPGADLTEPMFDGPFIAEDDTLHR